MCGWMGQCLYFDQTKTNQNNSIDSYIKVNIDIFCLGKPWEKNLSIKNVLSLSGVPDYFGRNKISSGGDLSHYSSASLY